jgi:tetratricopeptide (TPR) repeat protein
MLKPQKRITKKEIRRDPLMEFLYNLRHWWLVHKKKVYRYGSIALVVIVLLSIVFRWRSAQDAKAASLVGIAFVEFGHGNYQTVIAQLAPAVDEYSGLKSFGNGLFILARSELYIGDSTAAEEHFQLYLDDYAKDPLLSAGAQAGLGIIAEGRGEYLTAAELFKKAGRSAPSEGLQHRYTIYSARNFLSAGNPQETLNLLTPILDQDLDYSTMNEVRELTATAQAMVKNNGGA